MPKTKPPKIINQEVLKAMKFLTEKNPYVHVKIRDIVNRVRFQIKHILFEHNMDQMIRDAILKLTDLGLIDHIGHNRYYFTNLFANDGENEEPAMKQPNLVKGPGNPDPTHFKPNSKKKTRPENTSALDPNRKRRNSDLKSSTSLSGDSIEKTRKRFYGKKQVVKNDKFVPLPGARQVPKGKRKLEENPSLLQMKSKKQKLEGIKNLVNLKEKFPSAVVYNGIQLKEIPISRGNDIPPTLIPTKNSYMCQIIDSDNTIEFNGSSDYYVKERYLDMESNNGSSNYSASDIDGQSSDQQNEVGTDEELETNINSGTLFEKILN